MKGEMIRCPHCECKVSAREVEKEEGYCPECGQPLAMPNEHLFDDYDDDADEGKELDEFGFEEEEEDMDEEDFDEEDFDDEDDEDDEEDEGAEYAPHRTRPSRSRRRNRDSDDY